MNKRLFSFLVVFAVLATGSTATNREIASSGANFCQGCRSIISYMTNFNSTEHRAEYKDLFRNFCELYYPASTDFQSGPCPLFVESLFHVIDKIDPVHHCDQIGACYSPLVAVPQPQQIENELPSRASNAVCEVCELVVKQVQAQLDDPKAIDDLHKQVDAFCDYLKVVDQDKQCKQMINKYIDDAVDFVRNMDPLQYCQSIQLCGARQETSRKPPQMLPTLADFSDFGIETSVSIGGQVVKGIDLTANNHVRGPICIFCKAIIEKLNGFLINNRTEESIRDGLDYVCTALYKPGESLKNCESFIAGYTKELVDILADETSPELVCMMLGQCLYQAEFENTAITPQSDPPKEEGSVSIAQFLKMMDPSIGSLRVCVECKLFIKYLQSALEDPKSEDEMKNWLLSNLCDNLAEEHLKKSCRDMVNSYIDDFFMAVAKDLNPQTTCVELGACTRKLSSILLLNLEPSSALSQFIPERTSGVQVRPIQVLSDVLAAKDEKNEFCDQCIEVIKKIDDYISTNSEHDADTIIKQVCYLLPGSAESECANIVMLFGDEIVQIISSMDNPRQVCEKVAIC